MNERVKKKTIQRGGKAQEGSKKDRTGLNFEGFPGPHPGVALGRRLCSRIQKPLPDGERPDMGVHALQGRKRKDRQLINDR